MSRFLVLIAFIVVLQAVGAFIGISFSPDGWYEALNKPAFNPPGSVFGTVWPVLYVLIAIAGWRVFISGGATPGWGLWVTQLLLNWLWSPLFFGAHQVFFGIWVILATLLVSLAFTIRVWDKDKLAALCFVPYVAWLSFALLLNASIWYLN